MNKIADFVLSRNGFKELNPVQKLFLEVEKDKNVIVSAPTASGKSLIAEIWSASIINNGKKVLYMCPLKAIASEQHNSVTKAFGNLWKIKISTGDLDSRDWYLEDADFIITTYEKADSLIRHKSPFLKDIGLLVVDEIHNLGSSHGATLEMVITYLRLLNKDLKILGLSATIPNVQELAAWLDARTVTSKWRPVNLKRGICIDNTIEFEDSSKIDLNLPGVEGITIDTLNKGKQILIFRNSRKLAESSAKNLAEICKKYINVKENQKIAQDVLSALEQPTKQCKQLAEVVSKGAAFHHAGLTSIQRQIVENAFRAGKIKVICATPTLAAGVNLPAYRVIIRDLTRYTAAGIQQIPVSEYIQQAGRAGRPGLDDTGEAICIANSPTQAEKIWNIYIRGSPEPIQSQLSNEIILRAELLAIVATGFANSKDRIHEILSKTLYAQQYGDLESLKEITDNILEELKNMGFIKENKLLLPTKLGARVSDLYIDPLSAYNIISKIPEIESSEKIPGILFTLINTTELKPYLQVKRNEEGEILAHMYSIEPELYHDIFQLQFEDYHLLNKIKLEKMVLNWISEKTEDEILEKYNVAPGILRMILTNLDWIAYSASELAKIMGAKKATLRFNKIRLRIKYGIKEELLPIIQIKGIGRMRARKLYAHNIKTPADIKKHTSLVEQILGDKTAHKILQEIQGKE